MNEYQYGVHETHCCVVHGCKYRDPDCPVENKVINQDYLCEDCNSDGIANKDPKMSEKLAYIISPMTDAEIECGQLLSQANRIWNERIRVENGIKENGNEDLDFGRSINECHRIIMTQYIRKELKGKELVVVQNVTTPNPTEPPVS